MNRYLANTQKSRQLYEKAKRVFPSGVSYFIRHMDPYPFYTAKARGSRLVDVDKNEYIDFWMGHYALILGHSPPEIMREVKRQIEKGTHYGTCHELEITSAEQVAKMVPSAEMVRFTNSGTEASMYATRLARSYTKRDRIAKFEGGWHGGYDPLLLAVKPPFDLSESSGLTDGTLKDTVVLPFNDVNGVEDAIKKEELAAVVVEPVLGAGGCIPARKEFLKALRQVCSENGTLLVFDEIITGFRLAPGGAQQFLGVLPDITVMGKILGGGFPVGAIGGPREIMDLMDPLLYARPNFSFHGGTFCANPVTMTAGLATLKTLENGTIISDLNKRGAKLRQELASIFERKDVDVQVVGTSSLFHTHFTDEEIDNVHAVFRADRDKLAQYHTHLIANGVFFLPTKTGALSAAHTKTDLEELLIETEDYVRNNY
ncbi:MAG: glutamate-1-semialdehyde 2,1-aminomutase [Candidatus Bathyarchaeota archaeon]|nr:MAG: glutamate-1-semialdehyde 2,1-aminomutase [Candidatus Bathyarchaeota archaeon]